MEPSETGLSSYYHHQHQHQHHHSIAGVTSPSNGIMANTEGTTTAMVYPHSVAGRAPAAALESGKRKRGRPRKYGTSEQGSSASKTTGSLVSSGMVSTKKKDQAQLGSASSASSPLSAKKSQLSALGNTGQGFIPHVVTISPGEDVLQKIMSFMQQSKREICILSACGAISNAHLRQPSSAGGQVLYEGRFEIISLSGSYVRNEFGERNGGLSVCLSTTDGQIIGGGVGGPLLAAGPIQVIVGTFLIDNKKEASGGVKGEAAARKFSPPVGPTPGPTAGFRSMESPPGRIEQQHNMGGSHFMMQPRGMPSQPTDWRGGPDARSTSTYELSGRGGHESPENGDYDQIQD